MLYFSNAISRIFGSLASTYFPKFLQNRINLTYIKMFNIDMSEFREPSYYKSLIELFTRSFKVPREIQNDEKSLLSMCDSLISEVGTIENRELKAFQIKGSSYSVSSLLGNFILNQEKAKLEDGLFMNFYLSPADYHHYHSPCDMKIIKAVHITGKLYPVNFTWLYKKAGIFTENERVVLECETLDKYRFYLVFVGALNVGKMRFYFDENICTNSKGNSSKLYNYKDLYIKQGEEMGFFEMGSTVVFLGEHKIFRSLVEQGKKVKFGDKVITILEQNIG